VTGGASTVYGSDAVSGVVNFITRQDFEGLEAEFSAYVTGDGDSEVYDGNVAWGRSLGEGAGNISVFAGYLERHAAYAGDRAISSVPLVEDWSGQIVEWGSTNTPAGQIPFPRADLGSGPTQVTFTPDGVPVAFSVPGDLYNYAPINYLQVPLERLYGGLFLDYALSESAITYVEVIATRNKGSTNTAPVPARFGNLQVNLANPLLSPEARELFSESYAEPGSNLARFQFQRRLQELGPRISRYDDDYNRLLAGLRGDLNDAWSYNVWLSYTDSNATQSLTNDASRSRFLQGLLVDPATGACYDPSGGCVPVDPFGEGAISNDAQAFIRLAPYRNQSSRKQQLASGYVSGTPFESWAGPVSLAFGMEWRRDSGDYIPDEALFTGDSLGYQGSSSVKGAERVWEIYGEALLPIVGQDAWFGPVELELGGRLSHYDHSGYTDSYKAGLVWEPGERFRFRTMFQQSVRAPNLAEAFQEQLISEGAFATDFNQDPCSASQDPAAHGFAQRCIDQGIPAEQIGIFEATPYYPMDIIEGGNPAVQPETGRTWTAGVSYSGLEHWQVSVDYFDLRIEDTIGTAPPRFVCFDQNNTGAVLCDKIRRDPTNFNVYEVDVRTTNLGKMKTNGFDVQASYATDLPASWAIGQEAADFSLNLVWTYLSSLSFQDNPAVDSFDCAGTFGNPCTGDNVGATSPRNRFTAFGRYVSGNLGLTLAWRWLQGTRNNAYLVAEFEGVEDPVIALPAVPSKNYVDLGVSYSFGPHFEARLDVANVLDTDPPLMANAVFSNNTDTLTYDIFGRAYQLAMRYRY